MPRQNVTTTPISTAGNSKRKISTRVAKTNSEGLETTLAIGMRVKSIATVRPKKYAGVKGEITAVNGDEVCIDGAWFRMSEVTKI